MGMLHMLSTATVLAQQQGQPTQQVYAGLGQRLQQVTDAVGHLWPEVLLVLGLLLVITADLVRGKRQKGRLLLPLLAALFLGVTLVPILGHAGSANGANSVGLLGNMLWHDWLAGWFQVLFVVAALLVLTMAPPHTKGRGEYYALMLALVLGAFIMVRGRNLLMVYLGIELVSITSYILAGTGLNKKGSEAANKYLLFGAMATGIMLYGMSLLYGLTGTLDVTSPAFAQGLAQAPALAIGMALLMTIGGFLYKLSAVPFHLWSPDIYEGAPLPVVTLFAVVPKLAGLVVLVRFVLAALHPAAPEVAALWQHLLAVVAIITMLVGNFAALWQKNARRMLAYSSIAHSGFLLTGVVAWSVTGLQSLLFYSVVYLLMNVAAFMLVGALEQRTGQRAIADFAGLGRHMPLFGVLLLVVMVALTGLPPTAGFSAKLLVFSALFQAWQNAQSPILMALFIFGLLNTVVALFYYLRIPYFMFLKQPTANTRHFNLKWYQTLLLLVVVIPIVLLFFKTDVLTDVINLSTFVVE